MVIEHLCPVWLVTYYSIESQISSSREIAVYIRNWSNTSLSISQSKLTDWDFQALFFVTDEEVNLVL